MPQTVMNIHDEDIRECLSSGSTAIEPTECVHCSMEGASVGDGTDQLLLARNTGSKQIGSSRTTGSTKGHFSSTDNGHARQVQIESGDLRRRVDVQSEPNTTYEGVVPEVDTCRESGQSREAAKGGQQDWLKENNARQTAGVCPNASATLEKSCTGDTMRNCSCDENALCFCSSSVFRTQAGGPDARRQTPRKSSPSRQSKQSARDVDDVFIAKVESGLQQMEGLNEAGSLEEAEDVKRCKGFMEDLVHRIFNNSASICQEDNARFGEYCRLAIGRQWFARLVDSQRVNSQKVTEQTFYRLVQFFAVCLFECSDADDFTPGKSLMNMCFTFYHEHEGFPRCDDTTQKSYLYSHLTDQPIWKSLRFWNAAFFDAVHQERKQRQPDHQVNWRHLSTEERENTELLNENITFGQLATFLHNMMELELSRDMCQEFLEKMATIGNLSPDQKELIQSNIGSHFPTEMEKNTKNKKNVRAFNRLSFMKRKVGREAVV